MRRRRIPCLMLAVAPWLLAGAAPAPPWGQDGHRIVGLAAAAKLPLAMPLFFREAQAQLGYLNYEPDRWRSDGMPEVNEAFRYDHYIDLENMQDSALAVQDRFEYLAFMQRSGMAIPERDAGLLPFAIMEHWERLAIAFKQWREQTDPATRGWIEQRIINDAGVLGHFVADAANPHHTTVHHNGWAADRPNPRGFSTERTLHSRFESEYVRAHISVDDVLPLAVAPVHQVAELRPTVLAYIRSSHAQVERLYQLEQQEPFSATTTSVAHKRFTAERLAAGALMLRDLWWSAWLRSAIL